MGSRNPRGAAAFEGVTESVRPEAAEAKKSDSASRDIEELKAKGHVLAENLLDRDQLESIRTELEPHFGCDAWGRNDFEGLRTERIYSVLATCPSGCSAVPGCDDGEPCINSLVRCVRVSLLGCDAVLETPTVLVTHTPTVTGAATRTETPISDASTLIVPRNHYWDSSRQPDPSEAIQLWIVIDGLFR